MRRSWLAFAAALALAGCDAVAPVATRPPTPTASRPPSSAPSSGTTASPANTASGFDLGSPEVVASGLDVPWGIAFFPDGDAIVTERETGRLLRLRPGQPPREVARIEPTISEGETGLLGIAIDPRDPSSLVVAYGVTTGHEVARVSLAGERRPILTGLPGAAFHTGGHVAFGPDGMLYVSVGDGTDPDAAQDAADLAGKILRIHADGSIPVDNPDPRSPVWSRGHRNVEGFAWDDSHRLWATEFGEDRFDELNRIERGENYGWPIAEGVAGDPRFVDPAVTWRPAEASPAGIASVAGSLYVAALRGERLWRVPLDPGGRPGTPVALLQGVYGRIRIVARSPDGWLWIATSNRDGRGGPPGPDDDVVVRFPPVAR